MATGGLLDLFTVLDDFDFAAGGIALTPDPAIELAIDALRGRADAAKARAALNEQIVQMRSSMRALRFDLVVTDDRAAAHDHVSRVGGRLHDLSAALRLRAGELDAAREHLILGMACDPENDDLRLRFVELYMDAGAHADALDMLVATYERHERDRLSEVFHTFRLGLDLRRAGAAEVARAAFARVVERDRDGGTVGELAARHLANLDRGQLQPPAPEALEALHAQVVSRTERLDRRGAAQLAVDFLLWMPDESRCWFLVGHARLTLAQADLIDEHGVHKVTPMALDRSAHAALCSAQQAFRLATRLDPSFLEAFRNLALCELLLDRPADALAARERAAQLAPRDPTILADLAAAQLAVGDRLGALESARAALHIDPADPVAKSMIARSEP